MLDWPFFVLIIRLHSRESNGSFHCHDLKSRCEPYRARLKGFRRQCIQSKKGGGGCHAVTVYDKPPTHAEEGNILFP